MSYFLSEQNLTPGQQYVLSKEEARHIALSRRIKVGEKIALQDPKQNRFLCIVKNVQKSSVTVSVDEQIPTPPESPLALTLFQAIISENALDAIIQKVTELGAHRLILFPSQHSPHSIEEKKDKKLDRWNKISIEAAKQSDRLQQTEIVVADSLEHACAYAEDLDALALLDKEGSVKIIPYMEQLGAIASMGVFVGPEGGLSPDEIKLLDSRLHITHIGLGPRILRADTASITITAICQSSKGDMA
jgi:16S rRNA (uracil1498-N3)-methyltransferase